MFEYRVSIFDRRIWPRSSPASSHSYQLLQLSIVSLLACWFGELILQVDFLHLNRMFKGRENRYKHQRARLSSLSPY